MRFSPKSEEDVSNLLPDGVYTFEVIEAVEKSSKAGNPMIALNLRIMDKDENARTVFDYLLTNDEMAYKLRHFADTIGQLAEYELGELDADKLVGCAGQAKISCQPAKNGYAARNGVKDYVKRLSQKSIGDAATKGQASAAFVDDDIPFMCPWQ